MDARNMFQDEEKNNSSNTSVQHCSTELVRRRRYLTVSILGNVTFSELKLEKKKELIY